MSCSLLLEASSDARTHSICVLQCMKQLNYQVMTVATKEQVSSFNDVACSAMAAMQLRFLDVRSHECRAVLKQTSYSCCMRRALQPPAYAGLRESCVNHLTNDGLSASAAVNLVCNTLT